MSTSFSSLSHVPTSFPLPTVSEDRLHYALHLPSSTSTSNPTSDPTALATLISAHVDALLPRPWLWNKDAWELKVAAPERLEGTMRVGDAVDDEWLVVWFLREVSRKWPDLVISTQLTGSVRDADGEFMLIEAAHELPAWVSPENSTNRFWLSGGHLHLVPLSIRSAASTRPHQIADNDYDDAGLAVDPDAWVSEADAVYAVRTGRHRVDDALEAAVWARVEGYPAALQTHQHTTKAYLPVPVAQALAAAPELVQRAVESFYVRDPAQLRAAARMTHFPPAPAVLAQVRMTRAAYAQLQGQVFHPPRAFGPEWHVADPESEGEAGEIARETARRERRWRDVGCKIATGFEIMYREGGRKGRAADTEGNADDARADPAYRAYVDNLRKAGFFGAELEGSEQWKSRERDALRGWRTARAADTTQERPSFAYLVDKAVATAPGVEAIQVGPDAPEDSDDWLAVEPSELDAMMLRASGQASAAAGPAEADAAAARQEEPASGADGDEKENEDAKALRELAKKVEAFVGGQGDLQGALFADELSDEDMDSDDDDDDEPSMTNEERERALAALVPPLAAGEWGRKPSGSVHAAGGAASGRNGGGGGGGGSSAKMAVPLANLAVPKMRPPLFAKQEYDGYVSESDSDNDDDALAPPGTIGRVVGQMKWGEGMDQSARIDAIDDDDDEDMAEGEDAEDAEDRKRKKRLELGDDIDELMRRRVWGGDDAARAADEVGADDDDEGMDVDGPDVGEDEDEFIRFTRDALGISDDQWEDILASRRARGAFVPAPKVKTAAQTRRDAEIRAHAQPGQAAGGGARRADADDKAEAPAQAKDKAGAKNVSLDSFEAVMAAMDAELARARPAAPAEVRKLEPGSMPTEADLDDMDEHDLAAMDRELRAALKGAGHAYDGDDPDDDNLDDSASAGGRAGGGLGHDEPAEAAQLGGEQRREYEIMRDLLESYRSQAGEAGAVGNLFARLGAK